MAVSFEEERTNYTGRPQKPVMSSQKKMAYILIVIVSVCASIYLISTIPKSPQPLTQAERDAIRAEMEAPALQR